MFPDFKTTTSGENRYIYEDTGINLNQMRSKIILIFLLMLTWVAARALALRQDDTSGYLG
jgi:hypothetical protein